jgi:hypothetical protein
MQLIGVQIYNERESGGEPRTARAVVPNLEARLTGRGQRVVSRTRGVWFRDNDGREVGTVDFRPTREQHPLQLVARFPDESDAWLAGRDRAELPPGDYEIRVSLMGDNVRRPARLKFFMRNPGVGRSMTIALEAAALSDGDVVPLPSLAAAPSVTAHDPGRVDPEPSDQLALAKLDAHLIKKRPGSYAFIVANVGGVSINDVHWTLPDNATNWSILEHTLVAYPIPTLEPGDEVSALLLVTLNGPAAVEIILQGNVDGVAYARRRNLSVVAL